MLGVLGRRSSCHGKFMEVGRLLSNSEFVSNISEGNMEDSAQDQLSSNTTRCFGEHRISNVQFHLPSSGGARLLHTKSALQSRALFPNSQGSSSEAFIRSFSSKGLQESEEKQQTKSVHPLWNWPNGISMARLISGPFIAYLVLDGQWKFALSALAISGASDWLDGFVARRYNQGSVIGSYLDPLADKVLICSLAAALAKEGSLYPPLAYLIIGRDVFLVAGAFVLRFRSLNWKWPGFWEFFRTTNLPSRQKENSEKKSELDKSQPAPYVTPLYISKVNTVAQLSLIGGCITSSWYNWPDENLLLGLGGLTAILTLASGLEYYKTGRQKR